MATTGGARDRRGSGLQAEQFDVVAEVDGSHWWFVGRRKIMRDILGAHLPDDPDTLVIDVGCGPGANVASLTDRYRCVGIDNAPEAIEWAQARFPEVTYVCGEAPRDLGDLAETADAFLLMDVLEHVEGDRELLASLVEVMKPGALVFITVPADMSLWSEQDVQLGHHRRYDIEGLRAMWSGLPMEELLSSHFNTRMYLPIRALRTVSRLTRRSWGEAGSDMRVPKGPGNRLLTSLFEGESRRLMTLTGPDPRPYRHGVSLLTVLRKLDESVPPGDPRAV